MHFFRPLLVVCALALLASGCSSSGPAVSADVIYVGGPIVTLNDAQADAEALAVKDGTILAVGARAGIEKAHKGKSTQTVDLGGKTLMPGFIDGHAHAQQFGGQAVGANLLAPPDGGVNTIDDVVTRLKAFAAGPDSDKTGWIFGLGYDDALLGRHPTRADLDNVSTTVPVMATHISGHFAESTRSA
jgi:predicted amidohydrolase YtcJ